MDFKNCLALNFCFKIFRFCLEIMILVFCMFTWRHFASIPAFQVFNFSSKPSKESDASTRLSLYSNSYGHPEWKSRDKALKTILNNRGLRTEPWWTPTWTLKLPLKELSILTLLIACEYIAFTVHTSHSGIPILLIAHQRTTWSTWSKAFLRLTNA